MISDRIKGIILKKLYNDLSKVEIIKYDKYFWFIDREKKYWYFRYEVGCGTLLWRFGFFKDFFIIFTMDRDEFVPVLSSWVEEVLNHRVNTTHCGSFLITQEVEEVLNHRVSATKGSALYKTIEVEEVLNHKIKDTFHNDFHLVLEVDEVLEYKVNNDSPSNHTLPNWVNNALNNI